MKREKRLRRVGLLCCHFVRNYAYYRASWDGEKTKATNEFWATVQGNFLDIAVLEWLKLFGDHNDKHHWRKVVTDTDAFRKAMLKACSMDKSDLVDLRDSIKTYRDKFIAHLDSEETMYIPELDRALALVKYYYGYITDELGIKGLGNLPDDIEAYYQNCFTDSENSFGK